MLALTNNLITNEMRGKYMSMEKKVQFNVRLDKEVVHKLEEIVEYYQEHTKIGRVYKGDVLSDIIEKSYQIMVKQKNHHRS